MPNPSPGVISAAGTAPSESTSVKDTVVSVLISLVLAFVFRGFVVEAFQIPTGSMAPTLLGAHMRFTSPVTGAQWTVAPWEFYGTPPNLDQPKPVQSWYNGTLPLVVHDPMSNYPVDPRSTPALAGDRIFVLKYLYSVFDPSRFDVVVFKNPQNPDENFIKRLIGLPNEQTALVDGDVFARPASMAGEAAETAWDGAGWKIARKPERVQRAVWQPVYQSTLSPTQSVLQDRRWYYPPWKASTAGWEGLDQASYRFATKDATRLDWDYERWPLIDRYAYNEAPMAGPRSDAIAAMLGPWRPSYEGFGPQLYFPVSDLRIAAGIKPDDDGIECAFNISARGHDFQARLGKGKVTLNMRPRPGAAEDDRPWTQLASIDADGLFRKGEITNVEFWHADQALEVWIDGAKALSAEYNWSPAERIRNVMGMSVQDASAKGAITEGTLYRPPSVSLAFDGSPVTLYRIGMWRDLHYQATVKDGRLDRPGLATHPDSVLSTGPDQFFCCGDNSPSSFDGRGWSTVEQWVAAEIDPMPGVVHRNLLIGKAFLVYFPALDNSRRLPVPDVGRMRLIW